VTIGYFKALKLQRRVKKSHRQSEGEILFAPGSKSNRQAVDRISGLFDQQAG
jgi:hypothetical protein